MLLIDLEPFWLTPDMFCFKSPTGRGNWLTCKRAFMSNKDQLKLFELVLPNEVVVSCVPDYCWKFEGRDLNTITVTPSIDASKSGNWHGYITNGAIA